MLKSRSDHAGERRTQARINEANHLSMTTSAKSLTLLAVLISFVPLLSSCNSIPFFSGKAPMKNDRRVSGEVVPSGKQVTVWFVKQTGENLEVVPVSKSKLKSDNMTSAVEALLEGPDDQDRASGIGTEIPGGTILLGIKNEGDSVELNLSKRFASGGGPTSMETRLEQLAKTVKGVDSSKQLFVNVEGEPLTATSADGLEISQPIDILNH